jgi:hypothetical protein
MEANALVRRYARHGLFIEQAERYAALSSS